METLICTLIHISQPMAIPVVPPHILNDNDLNYNVKVYLAHLGMECSQSSRKSGSIDFLRIVAQ